MGQRACGVDKVLIANRGEIALRILRTLRDLNITSVVPYTPEDLMSPAAELADEAYALPVGSSYTDAAALLELAQRTGADAVHPGYGFLSEDAQFAQAVLDAGLTWIGPSPAAMRALGDKATARATALDAGVAPVPGLREPVTDASQVLDFAARHGYPVALKRTDGGGGRGITVLTSDDEVATTTAFDAAQAAGADLVLERFVTVARHLETQCARDARGGFAVVSTRECTLQRRNQKLFEEAPAPYLPDGTEEALREASRRLLDAVGYVGVATCEFLLTPAGDVWFLEVNPRLQVEHCVSEEVTGTDLVATQLRLAAGEALGEVPPVRGHSIELRITCEDPRRNLAPSTGTLTTLRWPAGPGVRIESGVAQGDVVTASFDPMLAKIVVTGADRAQALARAARALRETRVEGVAVCTALHEYVLTQPALTTPTPQGLLDISTGWIEGSVLPALREAEAPAAGQGADPAEDNATRRTRSTYVIELNGRRVQMTIPDGVLGGHGPRLGGSYPGGTTRSQQPLRARTGRAGRSASGPGHEDPSLIAAPMQAVVTRICVDPGQQVASGDLLVVLESMKMENYVHAPADGTVAEIPVGAGHTVSAGDLLVRLELAEHAAASAPSASSARTPESTATATGGN